MALSDLIEIRIEFGLGSKPGTGVYGESEYGVGTYGGSEGGGIQWTDMTEFVEAFTTRSGKSLGQPQLKQFRTATAMFSMDNTAGVFVPGSEEIPGFLELRPGRFARIFARPVTDPEPDWEPIWFGRIDSIANIHNSGNLLARVSCSDLFTWLSLNDQTAVAPEGAGETAGQRITRILNHAGVPDEWQDIDQGGYTMQETTLAQDALSMCQVTAASTGGDFWIAPEGSFRFRDMGWMSDEPDWIFGGLNGLPVYGVQPSWSMYNVVNETHYARNGGTEQVNWDTDSIELFGRRTHTRLDLMNDSDTDVATLGALAVNHLAQVRMFIEQMTVLIQDEATADFAVKVALGDMIRITVDTIHGWSETYEANVIAIADEVSAEGWVMTIGLQDAAVHNENGPFNRPEFSEAYHLGGPEPLEEP